MRLEMAHSKLAYVLLLIPHIHTLIFQLTEGL